MIRVLHGDDDFAIDEALARLKTALGGDDLIQSNTAVFEGRDFKPGEVVAAARTVPFLADRRLVIVRGLLRRLDTPARSRSGGGQDTAPMRAERWETFGDSLAGLPDTTELVFVDVFPAGGKLRQNGPGLRALASADRAEVQEFVAPKGRAVQDWVRDRFMAEGVSATPAAMARLADLVGPNLRLLSQEIGKLSLYARGRTIQPADVELMVAPAREANIFATVDAVMERRPGLAMRYIYQLRDEGASMQYILSMLARQVRMLILARYLRDQGLRDQEIGEKIGLRAGFALRKTMEQAGRFPPEYLASAHRGLLAADLEVKSGTLDERLALELLVARLSGVR